MALKESISSDVGQNKLYAFLDFQKVMECGSFSCSGDWICGWMYDSWCGIDDAWDGRDKFGDGRGTASDDTIMSVERLNESDAVPSLFLLCVLSSSLHVTLKSLFANTYSYASVVLKQNTLLHVRVTI